MNSFKLHLGFIFPLFIVCFCYECLFFVKSINENYAQALNKDYSVIILSNKALGIDDLKNISYIKSIEELDLKKVKEQLKNNISEKNLNNLFNRLPRFYNLKFSKFISEQDLKTITTQLEKIKQITKIQTFSKTHIKVYKLLVFIEKISFISFVLITLLSIALIAKQISIWLYFYKEKIYILNIFGASFFYKASSMLKMIFIDNLFCFAILFLLFDNIYKFSFITALFDFLELDLIKIDFSLSLIQICLYSLAFSFLCVLFVMFRAKR
ncbi:hypothetical protein [Campylobacter canadensis]|uniref:ABC transporter permease n=1 Tax=Campylobacter canadensis TaxID=449520 RepID=A0ABS7WQY7_9BACT|nr:hypothetical protein [Campylobacter canadensis]MBZ7986722.1 hypothetical protein [Campylobacter canadensis]MBZ7994589.1 hypothetical protein [Campylobacter canadensis]MBZ7996851.1 hypothetical protein [Campylobacter canadensis]MBZ7997758.1 hypothetical protein [Campylobacter canadensis]MBZ7999920.1 hypothetical protein [Campylobacter canadensis]